MSNSEDYWKELVDFSKEYAKVSRQIEDALSKIQGYEDQYVAKAERVRIRLDKIRKRMDDMASGILKTIGSKQMRGRKTTDLIKEAKNQVQETGENMSFVLALTISEIAIELQTEATMQTINPMLTEQSNREELTRLRMRHENHLGREHKDEQDWRNEELRLADDFSTLIQVTREYKRGKAFKTLFFPVLALLSLVIALLPYFTSIFADYAILPFIIIPIGLMVVYFPRLWTRIMYGLRAERRTTLFIGLAVALAPIVIVVLIGVSIVMGGGIPLIDRLVAVWAGSMAIAFYIAYQNLETSEGAYRQKVREELLSILGLGGPIGTATLKVTQKPRGA